MARIGDAAVTTYLGDVAGRPATGHDEPNDGSSPTMLYLVGRIDHVVRKAIQRVVREHGLSVNQYTTLSVLGNRSDLSNAQLARRSLVSPQSANEVLLSLEQQGLVRRRAHPQHGRILQIRLTAKGRRTLEACDQHVREVEIGMVKGLTRQEQTALRHLLISCVHALLGGLEEEE
jgi:DNA-binding MarR family transcriptional regulator